MVKEKIGEVDFDFNGSKDAGEVDFESKQDWDDFDDKKIKEAIKRGEIFPELKPRKNTVYIAILVKLPMLVISDKGNFYVVEIIHEGLRKSMKANRSFNRCCRIYKDVNKLQYSDLLGKEIRFQKNDEGYMSVQFQ